ncbi:MAG: MFS transporter [Ilumatobacteraceae bacterium]
MHIKRTILLLQIAVGILAAGYGIMFTMLDDWRAEYGIQETGLGFIVAVGFFTSFVAQLTIAPLADKGFARRLMTLGLVSNVVGALLMAQGSTLGTFLIGRFIMGLGAGMAIPAIRRIVVVTDPEHLGTNLGRGLSIEVGGFALGPIISAATVGTFGLAAPFLIIATALAMMALIVWRIHIPETPVENRTTERFAIDLLKIRPLLGAIMIGLALYLMIGTFDPLWVVMMDDLKAPHWVANAGISIFGLPFIFFGTLGGRIAQRYGPFRVSALGLILGAGYMTMYGLLGRPYLMLGIGVTQSIVDSLTVTGTGIAVALVAPIERQAGASGLLGGMQTLTAGIAATLAGVTYEHFGRTTAFTITAVVMVLMVATGCVLAGPIWMRKPASGGMATSPP